MLKEFMLIFFIKPDARKTLNTNVIVNIQQKAFQKNLCYTNEIDQLSKLKSLECVTKIVLETRGLRHLIEK